MPQFHIYRKLKSEEDFSKIGDFVSGADEQTAVRNAEGTTQIDPGTIYFVQHTDGNDACMFKAKTDTIALEPFNAK